MLSKMSNLAAKKDTAQAQKMLDASALFAIFLSFAMAFGIAGTAPEFAIIFLGEEYAESASIEEFFKINIKSRPGYRRDKSFEPGLFFFG